MTAPVSSRPHLGAHDQAGNGSKPRSWVAALGWRWWAWWRTPAAFRRVTGLSVLALAFIIVTGGAVRLTGSGLGCQDWPTCTSTQVVAPWQFHAWMEFGNRLVTGAVSVAIVLAVAGSLTRLPRRRDLLYLSLGLVAGLVGQIVLGGETVLHHLDPPFVMGHLLLSMVLLADAVILHHRAAQPERLLTPGGRRAVVTGPAVRLVSPEHLILSRLLVVAATVVIVLGTVVTSTGPHGGDPTAPRFGFSLHHVAQLHGSAVEVFLFFTVVTLWTLHRAGADAAVLRRGEILLVVLVAQAGVGYTQYFTGDPVLLVGIHLAGATSVVVAVLWFNLSLYRRPAAGPIPLAAEACHGDAVAVTSS